MFVGIGDGYWHRFDVDRLEEAALELGLREQIALARRARGCVLGQDEERKRLDRRLYLDSINIGLIFGV
jgi:hypothetical protein